MLKTLKDLFDAFTGQPAVDSPEAQAHALKLACAVLLVEVMRADPAMDVAERQTILNTLNQQFALGSDESDRLLELAAQTAKGTYDYHRFTSIINDHFSQEQKIKMVESMWQVAYADGHLDAHENHLISKVAGLLHVTHGEYIAAKLHAKQASAAVSS
jgi:uncharacterized tellurite resistance protein B-like protein